MTEKKYKNKLEKSDMTKRIIVVQIIIFIVLFGWKIIYLLCKGMNISQFVQYILAFKFPDDFVEVALSTQLTIALLFVTFAGYVIEKVDEDILGVSVKSLLFKRTLYDWNYTTSVIAVLIASVVQACAYFWSKECIALVNFIFSFAVSCWIMIMTYNLMSKRSKIYNKIIKRISRARLNSEKKKGKRDIWFRRRDNYVGEHFLRRIELSVELDKCKNEKAYNMYLFMELEILYDLYEINKNNISEENNINNKRETAIKQKVQNLIELEVRGNEKLKSLLEEWVKEEKNEDRKEKKNEVKDWLQSKCKVLTSEKPEQKGKQEIEETHEQSGTESDELKLNKKIAELEKKIAILEKDAENRKRKTLKCKIYAKNVKVIRKK